MSKYIGELIPIVGALVICTNIITEVLKKLLEGKIATNIVASVVSMVLTLCAFFAFCAAKAIVIEWYYVVSAVVVGFAVAYAAMFGFDKLKQTLEQINK